MSGKRVRRLAAIAASSVLLSGGLAACSSNDAEATSEIRFMSLAWQPASVEANKAIVEAWNEMNPDTPVVYVQSDWGSSNDQLVTGFEGGTAPDIFMFDSARIVDFVGRGWVADLEPKMTPEFRGSIHEAAWDTVQYDVQPGIYGVPFLQETQVIYANKTALDDAGISLPTSDDPWTWNEYEDIAKQLTLDSNGDGTPEQYGAGFQLSSRVPDLMSLGLGFGAKYFDIQADETSVVFGESEAEVLQRIHRMLHDDKTADPRVAGLSGNDVLPGFFDGQFAMYIGAIWQREGLLAGAPDGFEWVALPPLEGSVSSAQSSAAVTLSVSAASQDIDSAVAFIEFYANAENQAALALGDWMLPTSNEAAAKMAAEGTEGDSTDVVMSTIDILTPAPYAKVRGLNEWIERVATPGFDRYFADEITIDELSTMLIEDGNRILERYNR